MLAVPIKRNVTRTSMTILCYDAGRLVLVNILLWVILFGVVIMLTIKEKNDVGILFD